MDALEFVLKKWNIDSNAKGQIEIPGSRNNELTEIFGEAGFKKGVEIGVETGIYSEILCQKIPGLKLYCIDPWKVYPEYRSFIDQKTLDEFYKQTIVRLKPYACEIIRDFSDNASERFSDGELDFVYIDGNHDYTHSIADIKNYLPKIRSGGIISGHDFHYKTRHERNDVERAVLDYVGAADINLWFVMKKPKGSPSWFWIKA